MSDRIYITRTAELDLEESANYIEFVLKNPDAAEHLLDRTAEKIETLAENPKLYPVVDDSILKFWGIRFLTVNNYLAFYKIDEETNYIYIIRFLYGKRDWITLLKQEIVDN